jgi:hypothetical protein
VRVNVISERVEGCALWGCRKGDTAIWKQGKEDREGDRRYEVE